MAKSVISNKWCLVRMVISVAWLFAGQAAQAQGTPPQRARPGERLTVFLATFGQGDQVWEQFGHNAIWIRDSAAGTITSYNYGMFSFGEPGFITRFMRGRMLYWMDARNADQELAAYQQANR